MTTINEKNRVDNMVEKGITASNLQTSASTLRNNISIESGIGLTKKSAETVAAISTEAEEVRKLSEQAVETSTLGLGSKYSRGAGRLVDFTYIDGSDDDQRRAYMQLQGEPSSMLHLAIGENSNLLKSVYDHLVKGYTSIIILSMQENLTERQHILPTVGDSFAATFSGKEPQLITISGYLPFDGDKDISWFTAFVNAYKHFIRASRLAKYRCSLKLVFPDFASYTCYPISISTTAESSQDTLIPFTMTAVVTENPINKAYGYIQSVTAPRNTVEEVTSAESEEVRAAEIEKEVVKDPADVGKLSEKKTWVESVSDWVSGVTNSKTMQTINKTLAITNQVSGAIDAISGKPYGQRYYSGKIGRGSYD